MRAFQLLLIGVFFASFTAIASAEAPYSFDRVFGELPKTVVPAAYEIAVDTDVVNHTFRGREEVAIRIRSATSKIVLNTLGIVVQSAGVAGGVAGTFKDSSSAGGGMPAAIVTDESAQRTTFTLPRALPPGAYKLRISYAGKMETEAQGLFYQTYKTAAGKEDQMLATQFESTDARRFFPCWDEPAYRATYSLTVGVPPDYEAISNMPVQRSIVQGAEKIVTFRATPKMSTYLLVFAAGHFASIEKKVDGVTVRLDAPSDRIAQGRYALDSATELLAYYSDYFGYKYPLPKLDLIDIPGGFPGAMENWGGITFTERALLFDPRVEPEQAKSVIFTTIAHEMAHQWAGDLVTMGWWDDIWLNEGFADWMETKATDHFNPSWHLWNAIGSQVETAMGGDSMVTSHAIQQPVLNEMQAESNFDEIEYEKAGAIVRMVEQYLGENTFRDGARRYIRAHAYSNTTSADLWKDLGAVAHTNIATLADAWTAKPGFPLVTAVATCSAGRRTLALSQHRFYSEPGKSSAQVWEIPIAIREGNTTSYTLLKGPSTTVAAGSCGTPLLVNAGAVGYYRVQYDAATFARVSAGLSSLSVVERARVIGDAAALATAGGMSPGSVLGLIGKLPASDSVDVWGSAIATLDAYANLETGEPGQTAFDAYRERTLRPLLARLGWNGASSDPIELISFRGKVIERLGDAGDQAVIAQAHERFEKFLADPASLPTSLREPVLRVVGTYADQTTYEQFQKLLKSARSPSEARQYRMAMWGARDPSLANQNLNMAIDGEIPAEAGNGTGLFDVVIVATAGRQPVLAWDFFKAHETQLVAKMSAFEQGFALIEVMPAFWNGAPPSDLDAFLEKIPNADPSQVKRAEATIADAVAERARLDPTIDAWVKAH